MDLLKYLPQFEGAGKDKDSTTEHVRAFKEYLAIHEIPINAAGGNQPQWVVTYTWFGYSLMGLAKNWYKD